MSQYCAFSLIILCPWWEYIYTEEQLIDKSADVHVVYVSKMQISSMVPSVMDAHLYKTNMDGSYIYYTRPPDQRDSA